MPGTRIRLIACGTLASLGIGLGVVAPTTAQTRATPAVSTAPVGALAHGVVLDHGAPVTGARVQAVIWPDANYLNHMRSGEAVPVRRLPAVKTTTGGTFTVAAPSTLPTGYLDSDGEVAVMLVAQGAGQTMRWNYSVKHGAPAPGMRARWYATAADPPASAARGPQEVLDLGAGTAYDTSNNPATWVGENGQPLSPAAVTAAERTATSPATAGSGATSSPRSASPADAGCYPWTADYNWHRNRPEHFLNVYNWSGALAEVRVTTSSENTLGIELEGADGKWHGSGSTSLSFNSSHGAVDYDVLNHSEYNTANAREFSNNCGLKEFRPTSYYDLLPAVGGTVTHHYFHKSCSKRPADSVWWAESEKNATWSAGFGVGPISVSAQSGYGTSVHYGFAVKRVSELCGTSIKGPVHSPSVEIHNYY